MAEIHAMVVYLDDKNLQRLYRNADLGIGEKISMEDKKFSRKYK